MNSNTQILMDLQISMDSFQPLEITTTYRGMPVISRAVIRSIDGDIVTLFTEEPGLVSLRHQSSAAILGSDFFEPASARIVEVRLASREVLLRDFTYLANHFGERKIVRVEPHSTTPVELILDVATVRGELADLSLNGAGIRVRFKDDDPRLKPGKQVQTKFDLPEGGVKIEGRILGTARMSGYRRLSVRFNPTTDEKSLIYKYLVERRAEIERELLEEYDAWMREELNPGEDREDAP